MNDSSKGKKNRIKVGDTFVEGESIEVRNGKVYVDGVEINGKTGKGPIVVKVLGNLKSLRVDTGNVYINGRSKNMLLGPSGQNIYPEEIEDKLNSMTMVVESVVVQRDNKLVGLVYPDYDEAKNMRFNEEDIRNIMEQNRNQLNELLPAYEKIAEIEIRKEEFEKTPKRSIKRFLYT